MAKVGTVTSLTEELIRQLPDMDYSESHQDLFLRAVNILKELLNVLQTMEMCTANCCDVFTRFLVIRRIRPTDS